MKISIALVVRIADSDSFQPLEKAQVCANGEVAMSKSGGYYVLIRTLKKGDVISVKCAGYVGRELVFDGENITVYLQKLLPLTDAYVALSAAQNADRNCDRIIAASVGGIRPQILDYCKLSSGKNVDLIIKSYNSLTGEIVLAEPLAEPIRQGQTLSVSAV